MTRDEIDELMKENGIVVVGEAVYALVQLVIEREREACAKVCEEWLHGDWHNQGVVAAAMIRARGEK
jgi:hypothetical protein